MPSNRNISRSNRLSSERCTSPEDEHASALKYIETAYSGDIKPLKDLSQNFHVKLDVLTQYVEGLKQAVSDRINYFHAGLILQSSREVYSRKVDYLEMLLDALVRTASSVDLVHLEKQESDVEHKKCSKRHKQLWPKLEEFKLVSKDEITLLPESQRVVNFDLPKTVRLPPILPMLLMPPMCFHVMLRDAKGDVIGRKGDFRVNWPTDREGIPLGLAKQLYKVAQVDESQRSDCPMDSTTTKESSNNYGSDVRNASPDEADDMTTMDFETTIENGFFESTASFDLCSTPVPHLDHEYDSGHCKAGTSKIDSTKSTTPRSSSFLPMLDAKTRPRRSTRKLPDMMTVTEFLTGRKKIETSVSKRKRKAAESAKDSNKQKTKRIKLDEILEVPLEEKGTFLDCQDTETQLSNLNSPGPSLGSPCYAADSDNAPTDDLDLEVAAIMTSVKDPDIQETFEEMKAFSRIDQTSTPNLLQDEANDRYQIWSEKIKPILQELDERPKFNLRDTARTIIQDMKLEQCVPMEDILRHKKPEQVSRNFVALLQLCNTRNVEINGNAVVLISDGFKLTAEDASDIVSDS